MRSIPYAAQWLDDDDVRVVSEALRGPYLTQGQKVREFEAAVASYCGAKYAVAFNSGTSALHAACSAAGIAAGQEVITSPITFVASANAVLYCNGRPVFADVEPETINISTASVAELINARTKAIIPVHYSGNPVDLKELYQLARAKGLIVIEDAAHALGSEYDGRKIGACQYSDLTCLSFHAVKHITTGEGGMVLTNSKTFFSRLKTFRTHGITREAPLLERADEGDWYYEMQQLGFNYRLTDFQSALGISQLRKLGLFVKRRREIAARYDKAFSALRGVKTIQVKPGRLSAWHIYPIFVAAKRKEFFNQLRNKGIGVNVHYIPVYLQPYYRELGYHSGLCPNAEAYYKGAITLPLYPKMNEEDVDRVIACVTAAAKAERL